MRPLLIVVMSLALSVGARAEPGPCETSVVQGAGVAVCGNLRVEVVLLDAEGAQQRYQRANERQPESHQCFFEGHKDGLCGGRNAGESTRRLGVGMMEPNEQSVLPRPVLVVCEGAQLDLHDCDKHASLLAKEVSRLNPAQVSPAGSSHHDWDVHRRDGSLLVHETTNHHRQTIEFHGPQGQVLIRVVSRTEGNRTRTLKWQDEDGDGVFDERVTDTFDGTLPVERQLHTVIEDLVDHSVLGDRWKVTKDLWWSGVAN